MAEMLMLSFLTLVATVSTATAITCPDTWMEHAGNCYQSFLEEVTWGEAALSCHHMDSHLLTLFSDVDATGLPVLLNSILPPNASSVIDVYIGLRHGFLVNSNVTYGFEWIDGLPFNSSQYPSLIMTNSFIQDTPADGLPRFAYISRQNTTTVELHATLGNGTVDGYVCQLNQLMTCSDVHESAVLLAKSDSMTLTMCWVVCLASGFANGTMFTAEMSCYCSLESLGQLSHSYPAGYAKEFISGIIAMSPVSRVGLASCSEPCPGESWMYCGDGDHYATIKQVLPPGTNASVVWSAYENDCTFLQNRGIHLNTNQLNGFNGFSLSGCNAYDDQCPDTVLLNGSVPSVSALSSIEGTRIQLGCPAGKWFSSTSRHHDQVCRTDSEGALQWVVDDAWGVDALCEPYTPCAINFTINNARRTNEILEGYPMATLTFECNPGYLFGDDLSTKTALCRKDGSWLVTSIYTECVLVRCNLPIVQNSQTTVDQASFAPGSTASFECSPNFAFEDRATRHTAECLDSGLWLLSSRVKCQDLRLVMTSATPPGECPAYLPAYQNTSTNLHPSYSVTDPDAYAAFLSIHWTENTVKRVLCPKGLVFTDLRSVSEIWCQSNGEWFFGFGECININIDVPRLDFASAEPQPYWKEYVPLLAAVGVLLVAVSVLAGYIVLTRKQNSTQLDQLLLEEAVKQEPAGDAPPPSVRQPPVTVSSRVSIHDIESARDIVELRHPGAVPSVGGTLYYQAASKHNRHYVASTPSEPLSNITEQSMYTVSEMPHSGPMPQPTLHTSDRNATSVNDVVLESTPLQTHSRLPAGASHEVRDEVLSTSEPAKRDAPSSPSKA